MYPDRQIVATLSQQLGWSHFVELLSLDDTLKRDFYSEMCRIEKWNVRTLRSKMNGMLFERTGLSKKSKEVMRMELAKLRKKDQLSPELVFRDPYFLDFLGLQGAYSERDLESAILTQLERFLVELGTDFSFVARQKRMHLGSKDYHLDLLFFHRRLRALVAVELKLGRFEPADMGQMEFYLRWLDKHERRPGEKAPLGLVLCASKDQEDVELIRLGARGIHVSQYLTELPPRRLLDISSEAPLGGQASSCRPLDYKRFILQTEWTIDASTFFACPDIHGAISKIVFQKPGIYQMLISEMPMYTDAPISEPDVVEIHYY